ncbi:MAG: C_GCAxxG_C_C family protein [Clostridia bacterium]|nr:C_GCAxxG_C_C family protein [Clostridia bacterium]
MSRGDIARQLFLEGYNCSQAVVGAFSDLLGIEKSVAVKMASGFGGGMGRMRETCGAVSGSVFVLSAIFGYEDTDFEKKKELYKIIQGFLKDFKEYKGSLNCAELLQLKAKEQSFVPEKRTEEYYNTRPCPLIIYEVADRLEKYLQALKVMGL